MSVQPRWLRRLRTTGRSLFGRRYIDADLTAELSAYVDERVERDAGAGRDAADARRRALSEIGGLTAMRDRLREERPALRLVDRVDTIAADVRYGVRRLVQSPRFTIPAVLSLGLGFAIATSTFGIINAFALRPAPVPDGEHLLVLAASRPPSDTLRYLSYPNYVDLRDRNTTFRGLAAYTIVDARLVVGAASLPVRGQAASGNYFQTFGISPWLGRLLTPDDDTPGAAPVLVVNAAFWTSALTSDPGVVGRRVLVNGHPFTIAGVAPEGFRGTDALFPADVWIPMTPAADAGLVSLGDRNGRNARVEGFVRPGVTTAAAQANLNALTKTLRDQYPVANHDLGTRLVPERDTRPIIDAAPLVVPVAALLIGVALVGLAIDGASVASLLLARAAARQREIAIRLALGATRGRLIRQLLVESLLLSVVAAALGYAATDACLAAFSRLTLPGGQMIDVHVDGAVAMFMAILALALGVAVGTWPAFRAARSDAASALKDGTGPATATGAGRLRRQIVAAQFSALTLLLVVTAIFVSSVRSAAHADLGLQTRDRWLFTLAPDEFGYDAAKGAALVRAFADRVRALPGVVSAAAVHEPPFGWDSSSFELAPADRAGATPAVRVANTIVTPGYFDAIGTPVLLGRAFDETDRDTSRPVAIINDTLARAFWPNENALGKRIVIPGDRGDRASFEVVGVAKTGKYSSATEPPQPFVWRPYAQAYRSPMTLVVRVQGDAAATVAAVRAVLTEIDPAVGLSNVMPFDALVAERTTGPIGAGAMFVGIVGLVGFVRAAFGMYGLLSYAAALQTREIGIRMALGATSASIVTLVAGRGVRLALRGVAVGLVFAFVAARLLRGLLAGAHAVSLSTWIGVPLLLGATALVAGYLPIRRVLRANPIASLRHD